MNQPVENNKKNTTESSTGAGAYYLSQWIGALIFFLLNLGKIPFNDLYGNQYATRNFWVGYLTMLIIASGLFSIIWSLQ